MPFRRTGMPAPREHLCFQRAARVPAGPMWRWGGCRRPDVTLVRFPCVPPARAVPVMSVFVHVVLRRALRCCGQEPRTRAGAGGCADLRQHTPAIRQIRTLADRQSWRSGAPPFGADPDGRRENQFAYRTAALRPGCEASTALRGRHPCTFAPPSKLGLRALLRGRVLGRWPCSAITKTFIGNNVVHKA
jgi:hypothetical protein